MGYANLAKMPSAKKEYIVNFPQLDGGLNLHELDYRINNDESPEMKNVLWREGVLSCRDGQVWVNDDPIDDFVTSYERIWNGCMFFHADNKIYCIDPESGDRTLLYTGGEDMTERGKFFPYKEKLYYKTVGYYVEIDFDVDTETFSASNVVGYVPVTYLNCSPANGSGTVYQPENRISSKMEMWYNSAYTLVAVSSRDDISVVVEAAYFRSRLNIPGVYVFQYANGTWEIEGYPIDPLDYGIYVTGLDPLDPTDSVTITVSYAFVSEYVVPLQDMDLDSVTVDGVLQHEEEYEFTFEPSSLAATFDIETWRTKVTTDGTYTFIYDYNALPEATWKLDGTPVDIAEYGLAIGRAPANNDTITVEYSKGDYWVDEEAGKITFFNPPPVYFPEVNNTVKIRFSKENEVAYNNIMDCKYVEVYGGTGALCIVMAGSKTQPNAYFWNGQTSIAMDASYFPMTQYQLAGDFTDPITGFGKQQGFLIIFKEGSVGRATLGTETVDERMTIDLPYVNINAKIGCDLPYTIQLIENNLTWCNTSDGVHFLANTSSAYENNVICISDKINESSQEWNPGLLYYVRNADSNTVVSHDDNKRYWLVVDGTAWLWDYIVSNYKSPAWFYFDNINGLSFVQERSDIWHFDSKSRLTKFERCYYDYDPDTDDSGDGDGAIEKIYRFATQYFGTYDVLKTVNSVIINMRSDTNSETDLMYQTDYEDRYDLTPLVSQSWKLVPRDLTYRDLSGTGFAKVFRRKPHCRRLHYFTMKLENNKPLMDMNVVSAQIYYILQGRYR